MTLAVAPPSPRESVLARLQHPFALVLLVSAGSLVALHLGGLGTSPPGLFNDEASIGYNAWAIAHGGVDEHGVSFPLFFEAFGEYKNPIYIYLLAPFTWVLPLTASVARLPAALCGLAVAAFAAATALRLSGSRATAVLVLLTAGLMPWMVVESRLAMEVSTMVLGLTVALWCLARAETGPPRRWLAGCGIALGVSLFSYTPARLLVAMLGLAIAVSYRLSARHRHNWWALLPPLIVAYAVLLQWSLRHPDALGARYNALSITSDSPSLLTAASRFCSNYVQYLGVPFLFSHGDANLRHSTGFGGMLLIVTLPALVVGIVVCLRRLAEPLPRVALAGLLLAPVPAALTADGTPHSLRAAAMVPFLLLIMGYGWDRLWRFLVSRRSLTLALAGLAAIEVGGYLEDLFVEYPARAVTSYRTTCACTWFDTGVGDAIVAAHDIAAGHTVFLSDTLDAPYIQALFRLRPDPHDYASHGLATMEMQVLDRADLAAQSRAGDVLVLDPHDSPPAGAVQLFTESVTVVHHTYRAGQPDGETLVLVSVYRR